jgi:site-specific DNA recombinase
VDGDGQLVKSGRLVPGLNVTEAELVADVFGRIAGGATLWAECHRLNALGVVPARRYASGKVVRLTDAWRPARLCGVLHNHVYTGTHTLRSKYGPVERAVPALVPLAVWEQAQRVLASNRRLSKTGQAFDYLLRGLVRCADCGNGYTGAVNRRRRCDGHLYERRYYRCNWDFPIGAAPCPGKAVNADDLERTVWDHCREFIQNPGPALAEAQVQLQARQGQTADHTAERARLARTLAEKDAERERTMTLFRRNLITLAEAERELAAVAREQATARGLLDALDAAAALTQTAEAQLADAAALLGRLRGRLEEVERTNDWATKRQVVEMLVREVRVQTTGTGQGKRAHVTARYDFGPMSAAELASACA